MKTDGLHDMALKSLQTGHMKPDTFKLVMETLAACDEQERERERLAALRFELTANLAIGLLTVVALAAAVTLSL
jgi:hypothetical protein